VLKSPVVAVIIPHYDDLDSLDVCLEAIEKQTLARDLFSVIVVDNGSPQGSQAVSDIIDGRADLVTAPDRGAGPARNAGVKSTSAPLLAFTDADCIPEADWLINGCTALQKVDIAGGRMRVLDPQGGRTAEAAFEHVFAFNNQRYIEEVGFTVTANLFCTRSVFENVGDFRTGVSEDVDWCHRAKKRNFKIGYVDNAIVGHPARSDWPSLIDKWKRINAQSYERIAHSRIGQAKWLIFTWLLPLSIIAHSPRIFRSGKLDTTAQRVGAFSTLARLRLWRFAAAHQIWLSDIFRSGQARRIKNSLSNGSNSASVAATGSSSNGL